MTSLLRASVASVAAGIAGLLALGVIASLFPDWIAFAQAPRPAFDVVSIKQHTGEMNGVTFAAREGGRLNVVNNPIFNVIDNAYGISKYQLIGAPDWVESERYDIEARGPATAGKKEMMLMVQTLLADRFAMRAHFETRETPAYILTVAKGGAKLRLTGSEDCVPFDSTKPNPEAVPNVCGNDHLSRNNVWEATHISMPGVTGALSVVMHRPVIDQTGIKGTFDVHLQWSDDLTLQDNPADAPPSIYVGPARIARSGTEVGPRSRGSVRHRSHRTANPELTDSIGGIRHPRSCLKAVDRQPDHEPKKCTCLETYKVVE